jgi:hypothetical protein
VGQPASAGRSGSASTLALAALLALASWAASLRAETHWNLQAVTATGTSAWPPAFPLQVTGVLLTDVDEMLDATPNFIPYTGPQDWFKMGGEWQIAVHSAWPGDRLGTFAYMGQNYGNMPFHSDSALSYTNEAWSAEMDRLNHDPATGHAFRKGDLVTITANAGAFYGGKQNINETHAIAPAKDFTISLVASNYGLPEPEVISLVSLVRTNDNNPATAEDVFDVTRAVGGEHWQGMRVRINGLTLVTSDGWNSTNTWGARKCTVTDNQNRFFALRHPRYSLGPAPPNQFDAIGILNQESGSGAQGTNGYELFVQSVVPSEVPELEIAMQPVITWPGSLANYQLQYTNLAGGSGAWQPVTNTPVLIEGRWTVIADPAEAATRFYRLEQTR